MNKSKNHINFTNFTKKPYKSNFNFKYKTSFPSPKDSSHKINTNLNSPNSNKDIIMIKKKFLNKSKETESKSSYINYASPLNQYYKNNLKKKDDNNNKLILTSNDISNDKIISYLNNEKIKNISKSISVNKNDTLFNKANKHKSNCNSSINILEQRKSSLEGKKEFYFFHHPQNSVNYNNNLNKYSSSSHKMIDNNSLTNSKKNFFNSNIGLYNKNFLDKCLKKNNSKKNEQSKKSLNINSIDFTQNKLLKEKYTSLKVSPRKSNINIKYLNSRINKIFTNNKSNHILTKKIKSNSCDNNIKKNKKIFGNKFKDNNNNNETSVEKNIEHNLNINKKINKLVSQSQKNYNKIKKNIIKHFSSNNTPNKNLFFSNEDNKKKEINNRKGKSTESKITKSKINNLKKTINIQDKIKTKKSLSQKKNKTKNQNNIQKENKDYSTNKTKNNKNNIKIKTKSFRASTQKSNLINNNSTQSSSNHDSNYFLSESIKLSKFIKSYYLKSKNYPSTNLSFYKYGRLIGQGAFGKVNLGLNILTGRIVAIKSFDKQSLNKNNENKKKILYEIDLMKKLNHSNITKILENFESEKYILIIMEYINGGNLFSFVKKRRKLSEKTAKFLFKQIILGIKYIHSKNIVHRDIKLENILIDLKNNIKICDFGIGKILSEKNEILYDQCGTPMYMAPEILLSSKEKGYNAFPIDMWSAGIALYIMLSGTLPFSSNDNFEHDDSKNFNNSNLRYHIINDNPKAIDNISNEAYELLKGLLNKNPKFRFNVDDVLNHPWLKNDNYSNFKYHLFTKAEIIMLNKTYIDYRYAKLEDIKENFTVSNLNNDKLNNNMKTNKNCTSKSNILAPFNTIKNYFPNDNENSINDDLNANEIKLENNLILFANKVKEFNMNYELNNNGELDNGMLINSKTESNTNTNNSINLNEKSGIYYDDDNIEKKTKIIDYELIKIAEEQKKENILNKIQEFGYDKNYIIQKLNENELCHVTAIYYLMMNYESI